MHLCCFNWNFIPQNKAPKTVRPYTITYYSSLVVLGTIIQLPIWYNHLHFYYYQLLLVANILVSTPNYTTRLLMFSFLVAEGKRNVTRV